MCPSLRDLEQNHRQSRQEKRIRVFTKMTSKLDLHDIYAQSVILHMLPLSYDYEIKIIILYQKSINFKRSSGKVYVFCILFYEN